MSCVGRRQGRTTWHLPARIADGNCGDYRRRTRIRRSVKERSKSLGIVAVAIAPTMGKWIGRAQIAALCKVEQLRTRTARSASIIVRMRSLGTAMPLKPTGYVVLSASGYMQFNYRTSFLLFTLKERCRNGSLPFPWAGSARTHTAMRLQHHSITSSAVANNVSGIARPSSLATLRLMTRSNLVGC